MRVLRIPAHIPPRARLLPSQHAAHVRGAAGVHTLLLLRRAARDHPQGEHRQW